MIYLTFGLAFAALAYCAYREKAWAAERQSDQDTFAEERKAWAAERRDLNNRIQVPEAAPFMQDEDKPPLQHVPFDDDDAFQAAMEELQGEADPEWP